MHQLPVRIAKAWAQAARLTRDKDVVRTPPPRKRCLSLSREAEAQVMEKGIQQIYVKAGLS
jgi:hypothetical protein